MPCVENEDTERPLSFETEQTDGIFSGEVVKGRPSNERLLATAFVTFLSFASLQLVFAFIADSEAMKGDSAAMMVDSMTYLCNWVAEHRKSHFDWNGTTGEADVDSARAQKLRERAYRKIVLQMEIVPPLVSVSTLLAVTTVVTYRAIFVLMRGTSSSSRHPNLRLMMGFSLFNLGLDCLNVFCFARAKHLTGYSTTADDDEEEHRCDYHQNGTHENGCPHRTTTQHDDSPNLNMCSAYTHVMADTLRSFAVILAALTAFLTPGVTPEQADATAAIVVSALIALSLIPLFKGLVRSIQELRGILRDEEMEKIMGNDDMSSSR
jgi:Co/Zn/Cd efflux system component